MNTRIRLWVFAAAMVAFALGGNALARGIGGMGGWEERNRNRRSGRDEGRSKRYYVCKVRSTGGKVSFEVMTSSEYNERRKECRKEFAEAAREWRRARDEAKKSRDEFTEKKPVMPLVKKYSKTYRKEEEAQEQADKLQEKWDKLMERKRGKKDEADEGDEGEDKKPKREKKRKKDRDKAE